MKRSHKFADRLSHRIAGVLEEQKYKVEIAKSSEPLYGNLRPCDTKDDSVRLMSVNVNCLSLWQKCKYKVKRLKWAISNYQFDSVGIQKVCANYRSYKSPISLESLMRKGSEPIWVQKLFNMIETENIEYSHQGKTATVLNGALSKYIKY